MRTHNDPSAAAPPPGDERAAAPCPGDVPESIRLAREQMLVNEALVRKVFQREREQAALRASEQELQNLVAHQLRLREEERKRIARGIHDGIGQNLLALRIDIASLHQHTASSHPRLHGWVGAALHNLDGTIRSVRDLIDELCPFELELGIEAAMEHELTQFRRFSGVACELAMDPRLREQRLPDELTLAMYRALQECLGNVARHARASRTDVVLRLLRGGVSMVVSDNGVGIRRGALGSQGKFGMREVREALAALGGRIEVKSVRSVGTTVSVFIPLQRPGKSP